jgi:outer membrane protein assembly factor BamA
MNLNSLSLTILIISVCGVSTFTHGGAASDQQGNSPCYQRHGEQAANLEKAEKEKYLIRRVEFIGNAKTRDSVLRRRIFLQEGDVFHRSVLLRSLANVSKLKIIYPVKLSDVVTNLNHEEKIIDFGICFRERAP